MNFIAKIASRYKIESESIRSKLEKAVAELSEVCVTI